MDTNNLIQLGRRIKQVRRDRRLSQQLFAGQLKVSKSTIINYETGKRVPDAAFLIDMIDLFQVSPEWLMMGGDEITRQNKGSRMLPFTVDEDVFQLVEHLNIPAIKFSMLSEYARVKEVFKPLVDDYEKKKKNHTDFAEKSA